MRRSTADDAVSAPVLADKALTAAVIDEIKNFYGRHDAKFQISDEDLSLIQTYLDVYILHTFSQITEDTPFYLKNYTEAVMFALPYYQKFIAYIRELNRVIEAVKIEVGTEDQQAADAILKVVIRQHRHHRIRDLISFMNSQGESGYFNYARDEGVRRIAKYHNGILDAWRLGKDILPSERYLENGMILFSTGLRYAVETQLSFDTLIFRPFSKTARLLASPQIPFNGQLFKRGAARMAADNLAGDFAEGKNVIFQMELEDPQSGEIQKILVKPGVRYPEFDEVVTEVTRQFEGLKTYHVETLNPETGQAISGKNAARTDLQMIEFVQSDPLYFQQEGGGPAGVVSLSRNVTTNSENLYKLTDMEKGARTAALEELGGHLAVEYLLGERDSFMKHLLFTKDGRFIKIDHEYPFEYGDKPAHSYLPGTLENTSDYWGFLNELKKQDSLEGWDMERAVARGFNKVLTEFRDNTNGVRTRVLKVIDEKIDFEKLKLPVVDRARLYQDNITTIEGLARQMDLRATHSYDMLAGIAQSKRAELRLNADALRLQNRFGTGRSELREQESTWELFPPDRDNPRSGTRNVLPEAQRTESDTDDDGEAGDYKRHSEMRSDEDLHPFAEMIRRLEAELKTQDAEQPSQVELVDEQGDGELTVLAQRILRFEQRLNAYDHYEGDDKSKFRTALLGEFLALLKALRALNYQFPAETLSGYQRILGLQSTADQAATGRIRDLTERMIEVYQEQPDEFQRRLDKFEEIDFDDTLAVAGFLQKRFNETGDAAKREVFRNIATEILLLALQKLRTEIHALDSKHPVHDRWDAVRLSRRIEKAASQYNRISNMTSVNPGPDDFIQVEIIGFDFYVSSAIENIREVIASAERSPNTVQSAGYADSLQWMLISLNRLIRLGYFKKPGLRRNTRAVIGPGDAFKVGTEEFYVLGRSRKQSEIKIVRLNGGQKGRIYVVNEWAWFGSDPDVDFVSQDPDVASHEAAIFSMEPGEWLFEKTGKKSELRVKEGTENFGPVELFGFDVDRAERYMPDVKRIAELWFKHLNRGGETKKEYESKIIDEDGNRNIFYFVIRNKVGTIMAYSKLSRRAGMWFLDETVVDQGLRGSGFGSQLFTHRLEFIENRSGSSAWIRILDASDGATGHLARINGFQNIDNNTWERRPEQRTVRPELRTGSTEWQAAAEVFNELIEYLADSDRQETAVGIYEFSERGLAGARDAVENKGTQLAYLINPETYEIVLFVPEIKLGETAAQKIVLNEQTVANLKAFKQQTAGYMFRLVISNMGRRLTELSGLLAVNLLLAIPFVLALFDAGIYLSTKSNRLPVGISLATLILYGLYGFSRLPLWKRIEKAVARRFFQPSVSEEPAAGDRLSKTQSTERAPSLIRTDQPDSAVITVPRIHVIPEQADGWDMDYSRISSEITALARRNFIEPDDSIELRQISGVTEFLAISGITLFLFMGAKPVLIEAFANRTLLPAIGIAAMVTAAVLILAGWNPLTAIKNHFQRKAARDSKQAARSELRTDQTGFSEHVLDDDDEEPASASTIAHVEVHAISKNEFIDFLKFHSEKNLSGSAVIGDPESVANRLRVLLSPLLRSYGKFKYQFDDDMWADILSYLWRKREVFESNLKEDVAVNGYVVVAVYHALIDRLRKLHRRENAVQSVDPLEELSRAPSRMPNPSNSAILNESRIMVGRATQVLSAQDREIIRLYFEEGKSRKTISRELELPYPDVVRRFELALEQIRIVLAVESKEWTRAAEEMEHEKLTELNSAILRLEFKQGDRAARKEMTVKIRRIAELYRDGLSAKEIARDAAVQLEPAKVRRIIHTIAEKFGAELDRAWKEIRAMNGGQTQLARIYAAQKQTASVLETSSSTKAEIPAVEDLKADKSELRAGEELADLYLSFYRKSPGEFRANLREAVEFKEVTFDEALQAIDVLKVRHESEPEDAVKEDIKKTAKDVFYSLLINLNQQIHVINDYVPRLHMWDLKRIERDWRIVQGVFSELQAFLDEQPEDKEFLPRNSIREMMHYYREAGKRVRSIQDAAASTSHSVQNSGRAGVVEWLKILSIYSYRVIFTKPEELKTHSVYLMPGDLFAIGRENFYVQSFDGENETMKIVRLNGPLKGEILTIQGWAWIGRDRENMDIVLEGDVVSRRHAAVYHQFGGRYGGEWYIQNASRNGTLLYSKRAPVKKREKQRSEIRPSTRSAEPALDSSVIEKRIEFLKARLPYLFTAARETLVSYVDFGSGTGGFIKEINEWFDEAGIFVRRGIGIEYSDISVKAAALDHLNVVEGDVTQYRELSRKYSDLKKGESDIVFMNAPDFLRMDDEQILKWFEAAAFFLKPDGIILMRRYSYPNEKNAEERQRRLQLETDLWNGFFQRQKDKISYELVPDEQRPDLPEGYHKLREELYVIRVQENVPQGSAVAEKASKSELRSDGLKTLESIVREKTGITADAEIDLSQRPAPEIVMDIVQTAFRENQELLMDPELMDWLLGISIPSGQRQYYSAYEALFQVLEKLDLKEGDVVFDLGSGYGRLGLLTGILFGAQGVRAVGIEAKQELFDASIRSRDGLGLDPAAVDFRYGNYLSMMDTFSEDSQPELFEQASVFYLYDITGQTYIGDSSRQNIVTLVSSLEFFAELRARTGKTLPRFVDVGPTLTIDAPPDFLEGKFKKTAALGQNILFYEIHPVEALAGDDFQDEPPVSPKPELRVTAEEVSAAAAGLIPGELRTELRFIPAVQTAAPENTAHVTSLLIPQLGIDGTVNRFKDSARQAFDSAQADRTVSETQDLEVIHANNVFLRNGLNRVLQRFLSAQAPDQKASFVIDVAENTSLQTVAPLLKATLAGQTHFIDGLFLSSLDASRGSSLLAQIFSVVRGLGFNNAVMDRSLDSAKWQRDSHEGPMAVMTLNQPAVKASVPAGFTLVTHSEEDSLSFDALSAEEQEALILLKQFEAIALWLGTTAAELLKDDPALFQFFQYHTNKNGLISFDLVRFHTEMRTAREFSASA